MRSFESHSVDDEENSSPLRSPGESGRDSPKFGVRDAR